MLFTSPLPILAKTFFFLFIGFAFFLTMFYQTITQKLLILPTPIEKIEDEDVLAVDKMDSSIVKKYGLERVLTQKQISILKRIRAEKKMPKFPVFKNLPRFCRGFAVVRIILLKLFPLLRSSLLLKTLREGIVRKPRRWKANARLFSL